MFTDGNRGRCDGVGWLVDPVRESNDGFGSLVEKHILDGDGYTVERADQLAGLCKVIIEFGSTFQGLLDEDVG